MDKLKEKIFGLIVVVALGIIFIPMLFEEKDHEKVQADPTQSLTQNEKHLDKPAALHELKEKDKAEKAAHDKKDKEHAEQQAREKQQALEAEHQAKLAKEQQETAEAQAKEQAKAHAQAEAHAKAQEEARVKAEQEAAAAERAREHAKAQQDAQEQAQKEKQIEQQAQLDKAKQAQEHTATQAHEEQPAQAGVQGKQPAQHHDAEHGADQSIISRAAQAKHKHHQPKEATEQDSQRSTAKVAHGKGWVVQLGTFAEPSNAQQLLKKLRAAGFPAYSRPLHLRGQTMTVVLVGPYVRKEDINRLRSTLESRFNINGAIVHYETR